MPDEPGGDRSAPNWRPPHAYVPGRSPRHSETLFDDIKATAATDPMRSPAWDFGLSLFAERYFWEAHEVLEAVWMSCPPNSPEKLFVQAIIQWANAGLKCRMRRVDAAKRLMAIADGLIEEVNHRGGTSQPILSGPELEALRLVVSREADRSD